MNWLNLVLFALLYAASCVPMWVAGRSEDLRLTASMYTSDMALSIASYIYLWYAFPSTQLSLFVLVAFIAASSTLGVALRARGYDPYAELRVRRTT